jgi:hypothetical protein
MGKLLTIIAGLTLLASGCNKRAKLDSTQAVQQAIEEHLKTNSNIRMDQFTTEIENVEFKGETASALVRYRSKQVSQFTVEVRYTLKRAGDHWEVTSSSAVSGQGMNAHGNITGAAPSSPPPQNPAGPAPAVSH